MSADAQVYAFPRALCGVLSGTVEASCLLFSVCYNIQFFQIIAKPVYKSVEVLRLCAPGATMLDGLRYSSDGDLMDWLKGLGFAK